MNKILVPVDFSEISMNALSYAIALFKGLETEITVLHTYDMSSSAFHMKSMDRILEEDARDEMDKFLKKVDASEPNITLKDKIVMGNAVGIINGLGNSGDYDFIVMGTKGASGLKEVFIGSVAGGVISKTKAPVLVVPEEYPFRPFDEIVFSVGNKPFSDASVVEPLRKIVKICSCKLKVLHIAEEEKKTDLGEVLKPIEDLDPSVTYAFGTGNINQRINDYLAEENVGLLCLMRSKKDVFYRLMQGSVTLKQTFNSTVPLLILHE